MSAPVGPCAKASHHDGDPLVEAIRGIDTTALDCVQVNAAVLADARHGPGTHLALGGRTAFTPRAGAGGALPTVEEPAAERIERMGDVLGLSLVPGRPVSDGRALLDLLPEDGSPLYVVGDAFRMPWLPYHGHQHMEHSLLLRAVDGGARVEAVDAYDNETPYGRAEPVVCSYDRAQAAALFDGSPTLPVPVRGAPPARSPVPEILGRNAEDGRRLLAGDAPERYAAAFRDHPDQQEACAALLLETWLLSRSRRLHAAWAAHHLPGSPVASAAAERAAAWETLAGQCYLAARRVQRGRPVPPQIHPALAELLRADAESAVRAATEHPGEAMPHEPADVRQTVVHTVADILGASPEAVAATEDLSRLEGFASFQMVETVERLEEMYGVEFAPEDLDAAVLRSVEGLVGLVLRTTAGAEVAHA
ncbi:acyl carrier protein [Streptomyces sp. JB150]|uniref:acyl carrier protein n=1 Tax=Streptomyces sp. JB150 TaxID=2714844 RepID=UPI00140E5BF3|nr:acyl carrier protein [Streptomyces sp. JB150]QIJ60675.1 acyl carrier protein [Streptomyces sp. JB150]